MKDKEPNDEPKETQITTYPVTTTNETEQKNADVKEQRSTESKDPKNN